MVTHQSTLGRDWCITRTNNTTNVASAHIIHRYTTTCNMKKKNTYTCKQGDKNRIQSECLFFFSNLSPSTHSFSNQSLCAHKNIYIYI
uniref:Uncharacterized protein n=1 Tax=Rhipicephalus appendiculatus TaxID=34631 RepID=A0A131YFR1_RHIAP